MLNRVPPEAAAQPIALDLAWAAFVITIMIATISLVWVLVLLLLIISMAIIIISSSSFIIITAITTISLPSQSPDLADQVVGAGEPWVANIYIYIYR